LMNVNYYPYMLMNAAAFVALFAFITSSPVIFMSQWQFTEVQFSLFFAFNAAWMIVANLLLSVTLKKYSTEIMLKTGYFMIIIAATAMLLSGDGAEYIASLVNFDVSSVAILLFSMLMGIVTMGVAIVLSTSMSLLLQGVEHQYGKAVALAGFVRFICGFAITFAVSQMNIINVNALAGITMVCGVTCLLVMVFRNKSAAILTKISE